MKRGRLTGRLLFGAASLGLVAGPALAQAVPAPPPGSIGRPEDVNRIARPDTGPAPTRAEVRGRDAVAAGPCPEALLTSTLSFPLRKIALVRPDGGEVPPAIAAALAPVQARANGADHPVRDVCLLRDEANARLQQAGFVAVTQIRPQSLADGELKLTIITGRIVEIRPRGDTGRFERALARITGRLLTLDPLRTGDAERIILAAGDLPGVDVLLVLRPADDGVPGNLIGEVTIASQVGVLYGGVQNLGSNQIGRWGMQTRGELYGLTGLSDLTYAGAFLTTDTREQLVAQAGHSMQIGDRGPRFSGDVALAWTRPDLGPQGRALDYRSESVFASLRLEQTLRRSVTSNLRFAAGLDIIDQDVLVANSTINRDRLRIGFFRLRADFQPRRRIDIAPVTSRQVTLSGGAQIDLRQGLDVLGATPSFERRLALRSTGQQVQPTRFEGQPYATVFRGQGNLLLQVAQPGQPVFGLAIDGRGQYSGVPLLSAEEYAIGNLTLGRGYDPGANSGDSGAGMSIEARVGRPVPRSRRDIAYEVFGFYDQSWLWNRDTGTTETDRIFRSAGGGIRAGLGDRISMELLYAIPFDRALLTDQQRPPGRLLFNLSVRFFPLPIIPSRTSR